MNTTIWTQTTVSTQFTHRRINSSPKLSNGPKNELKGRKYNFIGFWVHRCQMYVMERIQNKIINKLAPASSNNSPESLASINFKLLFLAILHNYFAHSLDHNCWMQHRKQWNRHSQEQFPRSRTLRTQLCAVEYYKDGEGANT